MSKVRDVTSLPSTASATQQISFAQSAGLHSFSITKVSMDVWLFVREPIAV